MFDSNAALVVCVLLRQFRDCDVWPILATYKYKEVNDKQALVTSTHVYIWRETN